MALYKIIPIVRGLAAMTFVMTSALIVIYLALRGSDLSWSWINFHHRIPSDEFGLGFAIITVLPKLIFLFSLWHLWRLFGEFACKRFFSIAATRHIRGFAGALIISILFDIGGEIVWSLNQQHHEEIRIYRSQLFNLIMALAFYAIGYVLAEARKQDEELESYF